MKVYLYGVPGLVGGAATKIRHLILLLNEHVNVIVILPKGRSRKDRQLRQFLGAINVPLCVLQDLPAKATGTVLAVCEPQFFSGGVARNLKEKGLRIIWANEMMWAFKGEADAIQQGLIDRVLWVSEFQRKALSHVHGAVPGMIVGNYIDPDDFAFRERRNPIFTIGRVSRPDPVKYPLNFPQFYESFGIHEIRFRVMAWSEDLAKQYRWFHFDSRWDLLKPNQVAARAFLGSLDLFVYPLGHRVEESWGRSVVEAMLTGCPPLVPVGHQFHKLIVHGESGFICDTFDDWNDAIVHLFRDYPARMKMAKVCSDYARYTHCDPEKHRECWLEALS